MIDIDFIYKRDLRKQEAKERELLMTTSFVSNRHTGEEGERTRIVMEHGLDEHRRLSSSVNHMNQLISAGGNILTSLTDQR